MELTNQNTGEIILYQPDDSIRLEVRVENETVWFSLNQMAILFERDKSVISRHITNIFKEEELTKESVVANFATTAADGKTYQVEYFNLDVIISVGYRVKSKRGTRFRQWANPVLKNYLLKGYAINHRIERTENFSIETERRVSETEKKIDFLVQYMEAILSDQNDINEDTRMQLELLSEEIAKLQTNKIWIDKPQNTMLN